VNGTLICTRDHVVFCKLPSSRAIAAARDSAPRAPDGARSK
jgi:hypothetical protein